MKLHLLHLDGLAVVRANVADPFLAVDGRARLRPEVEASGVTLCDQPEDADLLGLSLHWHAYPPELRTEVQRYFTLARDLHRRVLVWVNGDDEIAFAEPNLLVFQHAVQRSRRRPHEVRIYPPFIEDVLAELYDDAIAPRERRDRPIVGFCGQATPVLLDEAKRLARKVQSRVDATLRRTDAVPEPWTSHVRLRRRVLDQLSADDRIETNFILRDRYRAGVDSLADRRNLHHATSLEYFANIRDSDYTVCVRGGGNFSVRLYETLCLGRRPLVIDTDGLLPWPDHPFWRSLPTAEPSRVRDLVSGAIREHRSSLEEVVSLQYHAREFWSDWLSLPGFLRQFKRACSPSAMHLD